MYLSKLSSAASKSHPFEADSVVIVTQNLYFRVHNTLFPRWVNYAITGKMIALKTQEHEEGILSCASQSLW